MEVPKDLNGWIVAIIALVTFFIQVRSRNKDTTRINMQEALKPLNAKIVQFDEYCERHDMDINALTVRIARNEERVTSHEAACVEHRRRVEDMFREIRDKLYE